jgi:hypothetical protein
MTTTKHYELRAPAVRAAKKAGLKDGEFEVFQVLEAKGKSHWGFQGEDAPRLWPPSPPALGDRDRADKCPGPCSLGRRSEPRTRDRGLRGPAEARGVRCPCGHSTAPAPTPASKPKNKSTVASPVKLI